MSYQIKCDDYILYDPRDDDLIVSSPKLTLEENTVGGGSFTIHSNHPFYGKLKKLKSVFEISDDFGVLFRGRMTEDSMDFDNSQLVDLEGAMAYFNDSTVRAFSFPNDFLNNAEYKTAAASGNVIEFFLKWLIDNHNSQVQPFQRFKLGVVTVTDPNNYITRSSSEYLTTWEALESKLFKSSFGGKLCIRYESDGNYIDYLAEYTLTNTQRIKFGENLVDLKSESDASETYSAIIPIGATTETSVTDESGNTVTTKNTLTIEGLADGDITDDIVKVGDTLYSKKAVEAYGWRCAPVKDTTWEDVTVARNLLNKGVTALSGDLMMLSSTMEFTALDLHYTDKEVQSFRIYRNVIVETEPHGHNGIYQLPKLEIDIFNPENTKLTVGTTKKTLTDINAQKQNEVDLKIESAKNEMKDHVSSVQTGLNERIDGIDGTYFYIRYSQYADGHVMTNVPDENTLYMGVCSTNQPEAPTDYTKYTWCKVKGEPGEQGIQGEQGIPGEAGTDGKDGVDGKDGRSQYLHIKYSDDGLKFTANNGETLGAWIGTLVDFNAQDSAVFGDYTWKKFTEDVDDELDEIRRTITEQRTTILNDSTQIIMNALTRYVETSNYDEFKQTVEAALSVMSDEISMNFTSTTEQINNVNGDMQSKFTELYKYVSFSIDGMKISAGENAMSLKLDNDVIIFEKNGVQFGWWDGVDFHTGNIVIDVTERAQFGNFAFIPRSDGSLSFLKVGG